MKIRTKLTIGSCALIATALIVTSLSISNTAGNKSSEVLEKLTFQELTSIRELTKLAVSNYFESTKGLLKITSADPRVVSATKQFREAYSSYSNEAGNLPSTSLQKSSIQGFYRQQFGAKYQDINAESIDTTPLVNQLSDNSLSLQYQYISANKHPLGNKELLSDIANDNSTYNQIHKDFHPHTREFLYNFDFYDIFIADIKTGDIIYSVFKELDYATSLINGPYANTGIGEAFKKAAAANNPEYVYLTDFVPYMPSYNTPVAFIASPIFDGTEKIGVMIFQIPVDKINNIATHDKKWNDVGLGQTGETVLVGQDRKLRSNSRQLVEDQKSFIKLLSANKLANPQTIARIQQLETNISLQSIDNPAIDKALSGEQGEMQYTKYTGNAVLSAYGKFKVLDQEWLILSEMDLQEATLETKSLLTILI